MADDFEMPADLTETGKRAYGLILDFLKENHLQFAGGCKTFYSPDEWKSRGESYGRDSQLIVVYDGGDVGNAFSFDMENYDMVEKLRVRLADAGLFSEQCTTWYSAVYVS